MVECPPGGGNVEPSGQGSRAEQNPGDLVNMADFSPIFRALNSSLTLEWLSYLHRPSLGVYNSSNGLAFFSIFSSVYTTRCFIFTIYLFFQYHHFSAIIVFFKWICLLFHGENGQNEYIQIIFSFTNIVSIIVGIDL